MYFLTSKDNNGECEGLKSPEDFQGKDRCYLTSDTAYLGNIFASGFTIARLSEGLRKQGSEHNIHVGFEMNKCVPRNNDP